METTHRIIPRARTGNRGLTPVAGRGAAWAGAAMGTRPAARTQKQDHLIPGRATC
jgi:hypothetical protein